METLIRDEDGSCFWPVPEPENVDEIDALAWKEMAETYIAKAKEGDPHGTFVFMEDFNKDGEFLGYYAWRVVPRAVGQAVKARKSVSSVASLAAVREPVLN